MERRYYLPIRRQRAHTARKALVCASIGGFEKIAFLSFIAFFMSLA
jgi:hypothetical protein